MSVHSNRIIMHISGIAIITRDNFDEELILASFLIICRFYIDSTGSLAKSMKFTLLSLFRNILPSAVSLRTRSKLICHWRVSETTLVSTFQIR